MDFGPDKSNNIQPVQWPDLGQVLPVSLYLKQKTNNKQHVIMLGRGPLQKPCLPVSKETTQSK